MDSVKPKILLIGQDTAQQQHCVGLLEASGFQVETLRYDPETRALLPEQKPHLVVIEISERSSGWEEWLRQIRAEETVIPVIFVVAPEVLNQITEVIREEAADFLVLPCNAQTLLFRIGKVLEHRHLNEELQSLQRELRFRRNQDYIMGASTKVQSMLAQIIKVAGTDLNVLITGETGTGKELVARAIHYNSKRAGYPFIAINCSAIPESLLENQLFGHVKGGYTDAYSTVKGLYEEADGGTLFLDEVADLPNALQAKLLRAIESGEIRKIGDTAPIHVNVRVLSATHKHLTVETEQGRFREDLYYRLNTFPINIAPLRERKDDIPLLVNHFFREYREKLNKKLEGFSASALQKLMFYHWPGNIRELENRIQQAMINAAGPTVYREDIVLEERTDRQPFKSFKEAKQEFEKNYIMNVLQITMGNVTEAARLAKKDRKDFYDVMRKYILKSRDFRTK